MENELNDLKGVGPATLEKLDASGISTLMLLATESPENVSSVAGISEAKARALIKQCREHLKLGFEKAITFAKKREKTSRLSTGCSDLDSVLGGGFESSAITEIYGRTGSGKTQISHTMIIRALLEDKKNKAIFLDSESTFRPSRIKDICEPCKLDYEDVMNRIYVTRSYNSSHQTLLVEEIEKMLQKDNTYRIIVIDSITSHFRADFVGRGMLASRQQLLNKHLHQLLKIADVYNMVIIVTNQVSSNPGIMYGNPETPIGGNILSHSATNILYVRPAKASTWSAKLVDSPDLPQSDCQYLITKNGIENIK